MFIPARHSYFFLQLGLAAVFLWFGFNKFIYPEYWLNAWVPAWFVSFVEGWGYHALQFMYVLGVFEMLVGLSLISGILTKFFSFLAILFLIAILVANGFNEVTIRDLAMIGGFITIILKPIERF